MRDALASPTPLPSYSRREIVLRRLDQVERQHSGWRLSGRLERFAEMAHEAGNTFRVSDQGEQAHATAAARAQRELEAQRSSQELGPWPIARACRVLVASRRFVRAES